MVLPMFVPPVSEVAVSHLPSLVPQPLSARAYAQALSRIYDLPVRKTILYFFSAGEAVEV